MVQCENSASNSALPPSQMDCALGALTPSTVSCSFTASRKSRDEDERTNLIIDEGNTTSSEEDVCGPPAKELAMLIYKNEDQGDFEEETYPSGTEISFSCIPSITGERTTWKVICENGQWIGRAHDCGN